MIEIARERNISAPAARVWEVVAEAERLPEWYARAASAEVLEGAGLGRRQRLRCRDIDAAVKKLTGKGVTVERRFYDEPWGRLAFIKLPGGGKLGVYQPRHPRALNASAPDTLSSKPGKRKLTSSKSHTKSRSTASVNRRSG